jgi:hypothetical protein
MTVSIFLDFTFSILFSIVLKISRLQSKKLRLDKKAINEQGNNFLKILNMGKLFDRLGFATKFVEFEFGSSTS